jgi:hypothetical protein
MLAAVAVRSSRNFLLMVYAGFFKTSALCMTGLLRFCT